MQMVYKIIVIIVAIILFSGCDFLQNSKRKQMDEKKLVSFFNTNKNDFKRVVNICKNYPDIRFIDDDIKGASFNNNDMYSFSKQNKEVQKAVKEIINIIKKLKLHTVRCGYFHHLSNSPFTGVSFSVYSYGLSIGGKGQSIEYDSEWYRNKYLKSKNKEQNLSKYKPLNEKGWFYTEYSN